MFFYVQFRVDSSALAKKEIESYREEENEFTPDHAFSKYRLGIMASDRDSISLFTRVSLLLLAIRYTVSARIEN